MSGLDIEELRQKTSPGERSQGKGKQASLEDDLVAHYTGVKNGIESGQAAIRDSRLVALANTLDDRDDDLVSELESVVASNPDLREGTKAYLLAVLARAGLQAYASEYHEGLEEAVAEYAKREL